MLTKHKQYVTKHNNYQNTYTHTMANKPKHTAATSQNNKKPKHTTINSNKPKYTTSQNNKKPKHTITINQNTQQPPKHMLVQQKHNINNHNKKQ